MKPYSELMCGNLTKCAVLEVHRPYNIHMSHESIQALARHIPVLCEERRSKNTSREDNLICRRVEIRVDHRGVHLP